MENQRTKAGSVGRDHPVKTDKDNKLFIVFIISIFDNMPYNRAKKGGIMSWDKSFG